MRKLVIPALPTASIPDPDRGDVLPPGGRVVDWTPHWARLAAREDVTVAEPPTEPEPDAPREAVEAPVPVESAEAHHDA